MTESNTVLQLGMAIGNGMREYAVHTDYAHICECSDADENLIYNIHIQIFAKDCHFLGQKLFVYYLMRIG